jgi:hypothetical protein
MSEADEAAGRTRRIRVGRFIYSMAPVLQGQLGPEHQSLLFELNQVGHLPNSIYVHSFQRSLESAVVAAPAAACGLERAPCASTPASAAAAARGDTASQARKLAVSGCRVLCTATSCPWLGIRVVASVGRRAPCGCTNRPSLSAERVVMMKGCDCSE